MLALIYLYRNTLPYVCSDVAHTSTDVDRQPVCIYKSTETYTAIHIRMPRLIYTDQQMLRPGKDVKGWGSGG